MDDDQIADLLEDLAERLGFQIRYETLRLDEELGKRPGGVCLLRGQRLMIIDPQAGSKEKIRILSEGIKQCDLEEVYLRPVLRTLFDRLQDQKASGIAGNSEEKSKTNLADSEKKL